LIRPCVVSAVKLGASLLILKDMTHLRLVKTFDHRPFPSSVFCGAHEQCGGRPGRQE
jgi:hypothetical protein